MPDAIRDAILSLIRSRTVRRPISALKCGACAKALVGGPRKLIPPNLLHASLVWSLDQHGGLPIVKRARRVESLDLSPDQRGSAPRGHDAVKTCEVFVDHSARIAVPLGDRNHLGRLLGAELSKQPTARSQ